MGKSYAFYQANRSNSYHENKSRTNCKEHDRSDNHASRSRLRADIREDPDLVDSTVRDRKRNSRWEGYREEAYHRVSRPPPKLKAIYNETGHDIHSLTLEEVQNVLCSQALGSKDQESLRASCPVKSLGSRESEAQKLHDIWTKQVERRGRATPFKTRPKEKRQFLSE